MSGRPLPKALRGISSLLLGVPSLLTIWSIVLAQMGGRALDFSFFGLQVASHPQPFALGGVPIQAPWAMVAVAFVAALGVVASIATLQNRYLLLQVAGCLAWIGLLLGVVSEGGPPSALPSFGAALVCVLGAGIRRPTRQDR